MSAITRTVGRVAKLISRSVSALLIALVRVYQYTLGSVLGGHCRFEPTCSNYCIGAIRNCGAIKGLALGAWRILRCNPWCRGGFDPPPECKPARADDLTPGTDKR